MPKFNLTNNMTYAIKQLKKFYGLAPYNGPSNPFAGSALFAMGLRRDFGMDLTELNEKTGVYALLNRRK